MTLWPLSEYPPTHSPSISSPLLSSAGFYKAVGEFVVIICIAAPLFSFTTFLVDRLVLAWRAFLTRTMLVSYFGNRCGGPRAPRWICALEAVAP